VGAGSAASLMPGDIAPISGKESVKCSSRRGCAAWYLP
jgi:hypothetical protein